MDPLFAVQPATTGVGLGVLVTGFVLGLRHGIDWDHIAAIADITSTTAVADVGERMHEAEHAAFGGHRHAHGGLDEARAHTTPRDGSGPGAALANPPAPIDSPASRIGAQKRAIYLGTLYALGHALVVTVLGVAALLFAASLPEWVDPIMGRVVGITLVVLGVYVFISVYRYARYGEDFRLRSRWMLVFDGVRYAWRRFQARIHGHAHVDPVEASSYGPSTAFGVGMIHGVGAETASQALLIAAVGGAAGAGLGVPMLVAFAVGLVMSNALVVIVSTAGFGASRFRQRLYLVVGILAGLFSLLVGSLFLLAQESVLPSLDGVLPFLG